MRCKYASNNKYTNVTQDLGISADLQRTKFKTQTQIFTYVLEIYVS